MPRVGQNPMKNLERRFQPKRVSVCTLVYIPAIEGYWAQSFDVLKICLSSLLANTHEPFDLVVMDNGSCQEVRDFLRELADGGAIQLLILAEHNMGKPGAWNVLLPACPGEYIAFTDSDVLFYPGWLSASLQVMETFERVGMVTARPFRTASVRREELLSATLAYTESSGDIEVERGQLVSHEILDEHWRSVGHSRNPVFTEANAEDVRISKDGVRAYAYAGHYQFLTRRDVALQVLPLEGRQALAGDEKEWDARINRLGLLRLSTEEPLVRHLGNTLNEEELGLLKGDHPLMESVRHRRQAQPADRRLELFGQEPPRAGQGAAYSWCHAARLRSAVLGARIGDRMLSLLRSAARVPTAAKLVESPLLNRLGVQPARSLMARAVRRARPWRVPSPYATQARQVEEDGITLIADFLPAEAFAALRDECLALWEAPPASVRCHQHGPNRVEMARLDTAMRASMPAADSLLRHPALLALLSAGERRAVETRRAHCAAERVTYGEGDDADPETFLHVDTFFDTHKAWLYLSDVTEETGPLAYVPRSHRLSAYRLYREYDNSVSERLRSRRISREEVEARGLAERVVTCPANTLVVANTNGYHRRLPGRPGQRRFAVHVSCRQNPFFPEQLAPERFVALVRRSATSP